MNKHIYYTLIWIISFSYMTISVAGNKPSITLTPSGVQALAPDASVMVTATLSNCENNDPVWKLKQPNKGIATLNISDPNNVVITYTNNGNNGYLDRKEIKYKLEVSCSGQSKKSKDLKVVASAFGAGTTGGTTSGGTTSGGTSSNCPGQGTVIFDMTANPGSVALQSNLGLFVCGKKSFTAIETGRGSNAINIDDFHVMNRVAGGANQSAKDNLKLEIGNTTVTAVANLIDTSSLAFFANGQHLFDLDRLRNAANWLRTNVSPDLGILSRQYGTISMSEFLQNIAENRTMYGIVRVKVPLQHGTCTNASSCTKNALNSPVSQTSLYGFCSSGAVTSSLCSCAPGNNNSTQTFKTIKEGSTLCGHTLPATAQINVKGALLWDFVAADTDTVNNLNQGDPIPLSLLPYVPRELYFKVEIPVNVNAGYDLNHDGIMDNMPIIAAYNAPYTTPQFIRPTFSYTNVPQESKDQYLYQTGTNLTQTIFDQLDNASKYHIMSANGYPDGWADAFNKLNITGTMWQSLSFGISSAIGNNVITANDVRATTFEDIPTYLYTGGLVDMHDHANISGVMYVPQGMEMEAKGGNNAQQYIDGTIVVRDTYYLESNANTMQLITNEPENFSTAKVNNGSVASILNFNTTRFMGANTSSLSPTSSSTGTSSSIPSPVTCYSCGGGATGSVNIVGGAGANNGGNIGAGPVNWVEIVPQ